MLRLATEKDISGIRALMKSVPGFWHDEWRQDALERGLDAADGLAYVREEAGEIVGFVCAHDVGFLGYLSALVVKEKARGQGVGRELVEQVEQSLAARGCAVVITDAWKDAEGFYRRLGWEPPDVVLLRKRLLDEVASRNPGLGEMRRSPPHMRQALGGRSGRRAGPG